MLGFLISLNIIAPRTTSTIQLTFPRVVVHVPYVLSANSYLTAHASTNSGATIIQNINVNRFQRAFHLFGGGTFGYIEVHAHIIIVDNL